MEPTPQSEPLPAWIDPFPEPRTMPGGWDLSGLLGAARERQGAEEAASREDPAGAEANEGS